jgi:hypothetical protein
MASKDFKLPGNTTLNDLYYMLTGAALAIQNPKKIADGIEMMARLLMEENGQPLPSPQL